MHNVPKSSSVDGLIIHSADFVEGDQKKSSVHITSGREPTITKNLLDMKTSKVTQAFIQGREINLDNKQKQLFERYKYKYGIK